MRTQYLEVKRDIPVVIETPEGFVEIIRTASKRVEIRLPGGMRAWHGMDRASKNARFLRLEEGRVLPNYEVLVPTISDDGELDGVRAPEPFRLVKGVD